MNTQVAPEGAKELNRTIARLAVPALATLLAEPLYVLADTAVVGHLGTTQLGGLALASTVLLTIHSLLIFLAYGTTGRVARLRGEGSPELAISFGLQAIWLATVIGVVVAVTLAISGPAIFSALGPGPLVNRQAEIYLRYSLPGFPALLVMLAAGGLSHGFQNTRTPLFIALTSNLLNLGLELLLIGVFHLGIGASALATSLAQLLGGLMFCRWVVGLCRQHHLTRELGFPQIKEMRRVLSSAGPLFIRTAALRGSLTYATLIAAGISTTALAAHQIAAQLWTTCALVLDAVAIAAQSLVGAWLGAGQNRLAVLATRRMIWIDLAVGTALGVGVLVALPHISSTFTSDHSVGAQVEKLGPALAICQPIGGIVFALDGILIGAQDFAFQAKAMTLAAVIFVVSANIWKGSQISLEILWVLIASFLATRAAFMFVRFRSLKWIASGDPGPPGA